MAISSSKPSALANPPTHDNTTTTLTTVEVVVEAMAIETLTANVLRTMSRPIMAMLAASVPMRT